jgi:aspartate oxidase
VDPADRQARSKILAPEALRGHGGILINAAGCRFVDELATRDIVTRAMQDTVTPTWLLLPKVRQYRYALPFRGCWQPAR